MGTLRDLKKEMRSDPELKEMLVRSSHREILIDLDGDGVADIGLIDYNHDGDIDMISVDTTGNGDFNLYVGDQDANGIPDTVEIYDDYDDMPIAAYFGRNVEDRFLTMSEAILKRIQFVATAELVKEEFISALAEFLATAEAEYEKAKEEHSAEAPADEAPSDEEPEA